MPNLEPQPSETSTPLNKELAGSNRRRRSRFVATALGSIPWVGGVMSAVAARDAEQEQGEINHLFQIWIDKHETQIQNLQIAIDDILNRLESLEDSSAQIRIDENAYLKLVRKGFRAWDQADTDQKRRMIRLILTNAGCCRLCTDDVVRIFLDWMEQYHEIHFSVIKAIYHNPRVSRAEIWDTVSGEAVREDSAEADLFKMLIRDLTLRGVIRQERQVTHSGEYLKKRNRRRNHTYTMKSAFDNKELYVLTSLGSQFVHYALQEPTARLEPNPEIGKMQND